jgi:tetratricopeptide (TPR) repeat protein
MEVVRGGNRGGRRMFRHAMRYDPLGFPIPPEFDPSAAPRGSDRATARPGRGKRLLVLGLLVAVVPALLAPTLEPVVRESVVQWSVQRAFAREARGQPAAAIGDVGRALAWSRDDAGRMIDLLCWRAELRLDARDASGAVADASRAAAIDPRASRPLQLRSLVHVVLARADEALADAESAVLLAGPANPAALNHRAYIRALVGRDLEAALADVEAALGGDADAEPALLDTRGYVLHLLGRHAEAIDDLNRAIAAVASRRSQVAALARHGDRVAAARELRVIDRELAVMHRHRGLACRAAGLEAQAEQDLGIAAQKGYDPSRGVM